MVTPPITIPSPELAPILERLRLRLLELPPDELYETGKAVPMWVAASFNKKGLRSTVVAFATKWKDAATLGRALKKGSLEILDCALWVVEAIDRRRALEEALAIRALARDIKHNDTLDFESLVRERALYVVSRCVDLLPIDTVVALAGRGDLLFSETKKALLIHPLLQTGDAIVKALQATRWVTTPLDATDYPRDRDLIDYFLKSLSALAFKAAVPALEEMFRKAGSHELRWRIATTLEVLGSTLPRETLVAMATAGALEEEDWTYEAPKDRWPPILGRAVSAVFAANPRTAYDLLAQYLDPPRLTDAFVTHGTIKTVADAVAAVLEPRRAGRTDNILHIHDGDVFARVDQLKHPDKFASAGPEKTGFYEADPRWAALIERMAANDPWWERYAWRFQDLSSSELDKKFQAWERRRQKWDPDAPAEKKYDAMIRREERALARKNAKQPKKEG